MKIIRKSFLLLFIITLFSSCVNNIDFDQAGDLTLSPIYDGDLIYFTVKQTDFIINGIEINTVSDITRFTVFENSTVKDNLIKVDVSIEINNKFNRQFKVQFDFLDENDNLTYSFQELSIDANQNLFKQTEEINIRTNPSFLLTKKMKVTINLLPATTPLDPNENVTLEFKSAGRFYINI